MLASGEDPLYIARRLIRFASEDIGNADPWALPLAIAAKDAYHFLGPPEGELALAQRSAALFGSWRTWRPGGSGSQARRPGSLGRQVGLHGGRGGLDRVR